MWGKGCWGVKIHRNRPAIVSEAEKMFHENHLHQYDYDQQLLIKYYQSMAAESMVYYRGNLYELNCCTDTFGYNNVHHIIYRLRTTATAAKSSNSPASPTRLQDKMVCSSDGEKLANLWKPSEATVRKSVDRKI